MSNFFRALSAFLSLFRRPSVAEPTPPAVNVKRVAKAAAATAVAASTAWLVIATPFVANFEGYAKRAYVDRVGTGHPVTFCYGATAADGVQMPRPGQTYTKQECEEILAESLKNTYGPEIDNCIKHEYLTPHRKAALVSAAYNLGAGTICKGPVARDINRGLIEQGCDALKAYVHADGRVLEGLVRRRNAEAAMCKQID